MNDEISSATDTEELDRKLMEPKFERSMALWYRRKTETIRKAASTLMLLFICWTGNKIYDAGTALFTKVNEQRVAQQQTDDKLKSIAAAVEGMREIPARVTNLEKKYEDFAQAETRRDASQTALLQQLSEIKGYMTGMNSDKRGKQP